MSTPGRVIILNGVGSVGKSTIARALQRMTAEPYLHVQMDAFLEMMPPGYFDHDDGLRFRNRGADGVEVVTGAVARRVLLGLRQSVAALARCGNNVIVDDVLLDGDAAEYRAALVGLPVSWVVVRASLEVIETRERARGDRLIGLGRWQCGRVHAGIAYDVEVDAEKADAETCAACIRDALIL